MEDGLGHGSNPNNNQSSRVLILVVMEDGLGQPLNFVKDEDLASLNPCCDGRWSLTANFVET